MLPYLLAPYLPMDRLQALSSGATLPERSQGAVLYADLSGFTPLTEGLTRRLGSHQGAEEVARQINAVYDALLPVVHRYRGSVIGFAGDSMTCYFEQDAGLRGVACALAMQEAMGAFQSVPLPDGDRLSLGLKVGIAVGRVQRFLVGDPELQVLEVLAGTTLERMAQAEQCAERGEVLLEGSAASGLAAALEVAGGRGATGGKAGYARVTALRETVRPQPWPAPDLSSLPEQALRPWLLPTVYERLRAGQGEFLTELRPVVPLFARFGGIDYDQDEAAAHKLDAFVRWVQALVADYGGTLLELTIGDKGSDLYIVFGAPTSHENDALRALRVAQAMRRLPPAFSYIHSLQVGLSRGTMRVGAYGGALRRTYGVLGDEVNLAARLMQRAAPGEVLVGGRVQSAVGPLAQWVAHRPIQVKGKQDPIPVFTLAEVPAHPPLRLHEVRHNLPMVGRREELAQIEFQLARAVLGQGQIVGIRGEAGMGKSRLVTEVIQHAEQRGIAVYGGACQSYGTNRAYLVWQPIWRAFFALGESATTEEQLTRLTEALTRLDPTLLPRLPLLGEVLGLALPDSDLTRDLDPALRKLSREALLVECLKHQAQRTPLLLILEDSHWLDPLSHDLLEVIGRALWNLPVLVLLTYRPLDLPRLQAARVSTLPHFTEVALLSLPLLEAEQLLRARWHEVRQEKMPEEVVAQVLARAQGNPFYLEELLAYLLAASGPRGTLEHLAWPASLESLVLSRLDQLQETERVLLKVASIIGRRFPATWLWGYYPALGGPTVVRQTLARLADSTLIAEDTPEPEPSYLFRHVLTQEITYASLPQATRANLHERLARYLEAAGDGVENVDLLAYHYERSSNLPKKCEYLRKAGEKAQGSYANAAAQDYYDRVLPLLKLSSPTEQLDIRLRLGAVLEVVGQWEGAERHYQQARALAEQAGEEEGLARSEQALGSLHRQRATFETAEHWLRQALERWERLGNRAGVSAVLAELGVVAWRQSAFAAARTALEASLHLCREQADLKGQAFALNHLGNVAYLQGDASARALHEESLRLRRVVGDRRGIAASLNNLGLVARRQGAHEQSRLLLEESLATCREIGDNLGIANCLNNLGLVAYAEAQYERARHLLEEGLALRHALGDKRGIAASLNNLGNVAHAQRRYPEARRLLEESLALSQQLGSKEVVADSLVGLMALTSLEGTGESARRATRMAAALSILLAETGLTLGPMAKRLHHETLATLQSILSAEDFASAWAEGEALATPYPSPFFIRA